MTIYISDQIIVDAYNKGLIPKKLYHPSKDTNKPILTNWGLPTEFSVDNIDSTILTKDSPPMKELLRNFSDYKGLFNPDGTFNNCNRMAESYAVSLAMDEKWEASIKMFDAIMGKKKSIDFVVSSSEELLPVADSPGFLGFEGIFQYANACYEVGDKLKSDASIVSSSITKDLLKRSEALMTKSTALYGQIADTHRHFHGGKRFYDVKKESLDMLVSVFKIDGYQNLLDMHLKTTF